MIPTAWRRSWKKRPTANRCSRAPPAGLQGQDRKPIPPSEPLDTEPAGEEWTEEELPGLFPALWEHFGEEETE